MLEIFAKLFGRRQTSKAIAKQRLTLVLVHDRAGIPPELMNVIQNEIITVISKHVKVDRDGIEMKLSQQHGETRLMAEIPIVSYRSRPGAERKRKPAT